MDMRNADPGFDGSGNAERRTLRPFGTDGSSDLIKNKEGARLRHEADNGKAG